MKICICNSKGGVGKTTLTLAISDCLRLLKKKVKIVDCDNQATLTISSSVNERIKSYLKETLPDYTIYDMPPYRTSSTKEIIKNADLILIPIKVSVSDLVSLPQILDDLENNKKFFVVFNEVRKPLNSVYRETKGFFKKTFPELEKHITKTELSTLVGFNHIVYKSVFGRAKQEAVNLIKELKII